MSFLIIKEMILFHLILVGIVLIKAKYFHKILLEISNETKYSLIFNGSLKRSYLFDKYLIEIALVVFEIIKKIILKKQV